MRKNALEDTPAHEVLEWIHRVFSNLKRRGLGILHGFRCKHLDWQRGKSMFALVDAGRATWKDTAATGA